MSEIPETKEDIVWKYFNCKVCGLQTGYLEEEDEPHCSKCALENAENIMKNVTLAGPSMDELRREDAIKGGMYCLQETISTTDPATLAKIKSECADNGCNICLADMSFDVIEWPQHYNQGKIQPIDVIEDWKLDFRLANAVKYIARAGKKDPNKTKQDLEKALWYIRRYIEKEL